MMSKGNESMKFLTKLGTNPHAFAPKQTMQKPPNLSNHKILSSKLVRHTSKVLPRRVPPGRKQRSASWNASWRSPLLLSSMASWNLIVAIPIPKLMSIGIGMAASTLFEYNSLLKFSSLSVNLIFMGFSQTWKSAAAVNLKLGILKPNPSNPMSIFGVTREHDPMNPVTWMRE